MQWLSGRVFDTLIVFVKELFEKINFEKKIGRCKITQLAKSELQIVCLNTKPQPIITISMFLKVDSFLKKGHNLSPVTFF